MDNQTTCSTCQPVTDRTELRAAAIDFLVAYSKTASAVELYAPASHRLFQRDHLESESNAILWACMFYCTQMVADEDGSVPTPMWIQDWDYPQDDDA